MCVCVCITCMLLYDISLPCLNDQAVFILKHERASWWRRPQLRLHYELRVALRTLFRYNLRLRYEFRPRF